MVCLHVTNTVVCLCFHSFKWLYKWTGELKSEVPSLLVVTTGGALWAYFSTVAFPPGDVKGPSTREILVWAGSGSGTWPGSISAEMTVYLGSGKDIKLRDSRTWPHQGP